MKKYGKLRTMRFRRLFLRFFGIAFLSCAILILLMQAGNYFNLTTIMTDEVDAANLRALSNVQLAMDSVLDTVQATLWKISIDPDVISYLTIAKGTKPTYAQMVSTQSILKQLGTYMTGLPSTTYTIYSSLNQTVISERMGNMPVDKYRDAGMTSLVPGSIALRQVAYTSVMDPLWKISLSIYPSAQSSPQYGLIVADIDSQALIASLVNTRYDSDSVVFVLNREGTILVDTENRYIGQNFDEVCSGSGFFATPAGGANASFNGKSQRLSWIGASSYDLIYAQLVPTANTSAILSNTVHSLLASLLVGTLAAALIAFLLTRYVMKPIAQISDLLDQEHTAEPEDTESDEARYILMRIMLMSDATGELEQENLLQYRALKQARSAALQAQITPHFLRNALQSICMMVILETGNEESPAAEALLSLSEIARNMMEKGRDTVTISEETDMLEKYVLIQRLAKGDNLSLTLDIPAALQSYGVPKLCLQPLVENAIRHGGHEIIVTGREQGERIDLAVDDDGEGMDAEKIALYTELFSQDELFRSQHVGLVNLDQRLKLLYGEMSGLTLTASERGGLRVSFTIPKVVV
ncbi:MAG: histidine kinase [Clostridia bacterium]|nr:histidine kinase [Clostridia bacterium]